MFILLRANRRASWNTARISHKAHSGVLLCEKRKPDGLFTFNKIILEEIVISQRNFLASSAILASKLIWEASRGWGNSMKENKRTKEIKESEGQSLSSRWSKSMFPGHNLGEALSAGTSYVASKCFGFLKGSKNTKIIWQDMVRVKSHESGRAPETKRTTWELSRHQTFLPVPFYPLLWNWRKSIRDRNKQVTAYTIPKNIRAPCLRSSRW